PYELIALADFGSHGDGFEHAQLATIFRRETFGTHQHFTHRLRFKNALESYLDFEWALLDLVRFLRSRGRRGHWLLGRRCVFRISFFSGRLSFFLSIRNGPKNQRENESE